MALSAFTLSCVHYHPKQKFCTHQSTPSSLSPAPGDPPSFCLQESDYSSYSRRVESYSICLFLSGLFHLAWCLQGSSMCSIDQDLLPFKAEWYPTVCLDTHCVAIHPLTTLGLFSPFLRPSWTVLLYGYTKVTLTPCFQFFCVHSETWHYWIKWEFCI